MAAAVRASSTVRETKQAGLSWDRQQAPKGIRKLGKREGSQKNCFVFASCCCCCAFWLVGRLAITMMAKQKAADCCCCWDDGNGQEMVGWIGRWMAGGPKMCLRIVQEHRSECGIWRGQGRKAYRGQNQARVEGDSRKMCFFQLTDGWNGQGQMMTIYWCTLL